jgi:glutaredoxin
MMCFVRLVCCVLQWHHHPIEGPVSLMTCGALAFQGTESLRDRWVIPGICDYDVHMIKLFFKTLRAILGPFMLLWEYLTRPQGVVRTPEDQRVVDRECLNLTLYQFKTCPFCIKVRQEMRRLSLNIATLDAQRPGAARDDLLRGGGEIKVPCLRIREAGGTERWLYESGKIIEYLRNRYTTGALP